MDDSLRILEALMTPTKCQQHQRQHLKLAEGESEKLAPHEVMVSGPSTLLHAKMDLVTALKMSHLESNFTLSSKHVAMGAVRLHTVMVFQTVLVLTPLLPPCKPSSPHYLEWSLVLSLDRFLSYGSPDSIHVYMYYGLKSAKQCSDVLFYTAERKTRSPPNTNACKHHCCGCRDHVHRQ